MRKKRGRLLAKNMLLGLSFSVVFFASALSAYLYLSVSRAFVDTSGKEDAFSPEKVVNTNVLKEGYSLLMLGYGGAGHDGGSLSDVLMVAHIKPNDNKVTLVSIPRDLWVKIPIRSDISEYFKINAAYAIGSDDTHYPLKEPKFKGEGGGGVLAKHVVSEVVGMPIDYFAAISFEGFKDMVDILGEVAVDVPVAFDDYFYPVKGLENEICGKTAAEIDTLHQKYSGFQLEKQFECRYEHLHFEKGEQSMNGEAALKFVRSRHSDQHGGDFARSERQKAILVAMKEKIISLGFFDDALSFFNKLGKTVQTDIDEVAIKQIADLIGDPSKYDIKFVSLTEENVLKTSKSGSGAFILVPKLGVGNFSGIQKYIASEIGETP
jgi:anionic cell wall polymer biosynthesis LytR-Cps2A-Psr (LCP) family protein